MDYTNYTAEDLVMEPSFRKWVKNEDPAAVVFWEQWVAQHPEKLHTVEEAKTLLRKLPDVHYHLNGQEFQKMWATINLHTRKEEEPLTFISEQPARNLHRPWRKIAAAITVLLVAGITFFILNDETAYETAYGETRSVTLPDGSEVMLNAHSSLTLPAFWQWRDTREVWLEGEAFFEVEEAAKTDGKKFVVHTGGLDVEVLGTSFNVNNRRGKTQVVLNTGKVQLHTPQAEEKVQMQPGDKVEFSTEKIAFTKEVVNPEVYSSWKENKLLCDGTPLGEIAEIARDRFGLNMQFEEEELASLEISGTLPLNNVDIFLEVLEESTGRKITKNKDQTIIHKK